MLIVGIFYNPCLLCHKGILILGCALLKQVAGGIELLSWTSFLLSFRLFLI